MRDSRMQNHATGNIWPKTAITSVLMVDALSQEKQFVTEKKIIRFVGNIIKKLKILKSQSLLYWKGYFIGYQEHF